MNESKVPEDRQYTKSHEWVTLDGNLMTVGITDYAQGELTDVVFVELPAVGKKVDVGSTVLVLESVKTVADVYAPVAGVVSERNVVLSTRPELVNKDPYGEGWIFRLRFEGSLPKEGFLSAEEYLTFLARDIPPS